MERCLLIKWMGVPVVEVTETFFSYFLFRIRETDVGTASTL